MVIGRIFRVHDIEDVAVIVNQPSTSDQVLLRLITDTVRDVVRDS